MCSFNPFCCLFASVFIYPLDSERGKVMGINYDDYTNALNLLENIEDNCKHWFVDITDKQESGLFSYQCTKCHTVIIHDEKLTIEDLRI